MVCEEDKSAKKEQISGINYLINAISLEIDLQYLFFD
jgi:hypothetical protein